MVEQVNHTLVFQIPNKQERGPAKVHTHDNAVIVRIRVLAAVCKLRPASPECGDNWIDALASQWIDVGVGYTRSCHLCAHRDSSVTCAELSRSFLELGLFVKHSATALEIVLDNVLDGVGAASLRKQQGRAVRVVGVRVAQEHHVNCVI